MYGGGRTTGVCVDTGEDMTYVVPCWEGSPIANATLILKMGGRHVTDRLLSLLSHGKYSFPDDTYLLCKRKGSGVGGGGRFTVATRRDVVREAKETFCRVAEMGEISVVADAGKHNAKKWKKKPKRGEPKEEEEQVIEWICPNLNIVSSFRNCFFLSGAPPP